MELVDESVPFQIWHHGPSDPDDGSRAGEATRRSKQAASKLWLDGGATPSGARFPPAFAEAAPGEARECRRARLEACTVCSAVLRSSVEKAVDETDAPTLQRLAAFVAAEHASATARTLEQPGSPAAASLAAEAAAARTAALTAGPAAAVVYSELFALNPRLPRRPPRSLPAAVLDAGGAPPQDTARAVAVLADLLTAGNQGAYLARLTGAELGAGVAVADVLQGVLRGWSGLDVADVDAQLLVRWHQDSTHSPPANAAGTAAAAAAAARDKLTAGRRQGPDGSDPGPAPGRPVLGGSGSLDAASGAGPRSAGTAQQGGGDRGIAGQQEAGQQEAGQRTAGDAAGDTAEAAQRRLRPRRQEPEPKPAAAAAAAAAAASKAAAADAERRRNAGRPLAVLLEGAEAAEPATLDALIAVLSEVHEQLPVTLVLTVRGAVPLVLGRLSRPAARALRCTCFLLPPPQARLDVALLGGILGSESAGVFPGPALLAWLSRRFIMQEASVVGLLRSLQAACIAHFRRATLSAAAAALVTSDGTASNAGGGDVAAAARAALSGNAAVLRDSKLRRLLGLGPSDRSSAVAAAGGEAVAAAATGWAGWAVALRCVALAVEVARLPGEEFQVLPLAAAAAAGGAAFVDGGVFATVAQAVRRLQEADAEELAIVWADQPAAVARGEEAFARQSEALQAILAAAEQPEQSVRAGDRVPAAAPVPAAADTAAAAAAAPPATVAQVTPSPTAAVAAENAGSRKRKPGSRASRRSLLVQTTKGQHAEAVARGTATALGAAPAAAAAETLAKRLSRWLRDAAAAHLVTPPFSLPGAAALCMDDVAALDASVAAAPRAAAHAALTAPQALQGGFGGAPLAAAPAASGILRGHPDAAVAYQLMQGYGEVVGLGRAFVDFADVATAGGAHAGEEAEEAAGGEGEAGPSGGRMSYAHRRKRRAGKGVTQQQPQPAADGTAARSGRRRKQTQEAAEAEMRARVAALPAEKRLQLAARYQEAALALQQAGLVTVRHGARGTQLQRAVWQPCSGGGGGDSAFPDAWDEEALLEGVQAGDAVQAGAPPEAALPSARAAALGNGVAANGTADSGGGGPARPSASGESGAESGSSSEGDTADAAAVAAQSGPSGGRVRGRGRGKGKDDRGRRKKGSAGGGRRNSRAEAVEKSPKAAATTAAGSGKRSRGRKQEAEEAVSQQRKRRR